MSKWGKSMKTNAVKPFRKPLAEIHLDRHWPSVDPQTLFQLELKQDEYYEHIPPDALPYYVEQAMKKGQTVASLHGRPLSLRTLLNQLLKEGVCIRFQDAHPHDPFIRAQYRKKPKTIEIYRRSLQQIDQFFDAMGESVAEEEIMLLHLYHEWFHHLEETRCGRTDADLAKVVVKRMGPFKQRKGILRTREIAAHTFTQAVMKLPWSPLLLDYLLDFQQRGWSKSEIREHFQRLKQSSPPNPPPPSPSEHVTINNN
ncbi:hypothetical protein ADL26_01545 [Thermoactinomyces vulgaris]|jgi:hypothetical protein|nr:hypothetical protein ADL26_01545 [Thermoactinomyces vulgaris]